MYVKIRKFVQTLSTSRCMTRAPLAGLAGSLRTHICGSAATRCLCSIPIACNHGKARQNHPEMSVKKSMDNKKSLQKPWATHGDRIVWVWPLRRPKETDPRRRPIFQSCSGWRQLDLPSSSTWMSWWTPIRQSINHYEQLTIFNHHYYH